MTQETCDQKVRNLIHRALCEMVEQIGAAARKNMEGRRNNPFNHFEDPSIGKYMMLGRSFDSQLGNRLQTLAFHLARMRYGTSQVPNAIYVRLSDQTHTIHYQTYHLYQARTGAEIEWQKLFLGQENRAFRAKERIYAGPEWVCELAEADYAKAKAALEGRQKKGGTPIDLIFWPEKEKPYCEAFEIKAGGNLDTKNAEANEHEVRYLQEVVRPMGGKAYFATCYNNAGEGNDPAGSIFKRLNREELCIGEAFWNKVLPPELSYKKFIEIYQDEFNHGVEMSRRLRELDL